MKYEILNPFIASLARCNVQKTRDGGDLIRNSLSSLHVSMSLMAHHHCLQRPQLSVSTYNIRADDSKSRTQNLILYILWLAYRGVENLRISTQSTTLLVVIGGVVKCRMLALPSYTFQVITSVLFIFNQILNLTFVDFNFNEEYFHSFFYWSPRFMLRYVTLL